MQSYIAANAEWLEETLEKTKKKMKAVSARSKNKIPYTAQNGVHDDWKDKNIARWTNGFWAGTMWLMYLLTKDEDYRGIALYNEKELDRALLNAQNLNHDVGFLWLLSSGANYRLFNDENSKNRILMSAATLAARYNIEKRFIRAWNGEEKKGFSIIDCMMNLPLLYLASDITCDPRFSLIARAHADSAMQNHLRPDGSVYHIICYGDGGVTIPKKTQGYDSEKSSWSRGQSWAVYGFTLSYIHTGDENYLNAAKRAAHYFIANTIDDAVPPCDFRAPAQPHFYDTSAGACAACGLIELAKIVPEYEKPMYINAAVRILKAIAAKHCDFNEETDAFVLHGCESYHDGLQDLPLIYGDYYFIEALYKLSGGEVLFW